MYKKTYESLKKVIDYLERNERKHFEESERPDDHIMNDVIDVNDWIEEVAKEYTEE